MRRIVCGLIRLVLREGIFSAAALRMARHERMNTKSRHGFAVSVQKHPTSRISSPDERVECIHCLSPERAKANFPTLALDLYRTSSSRVPSQILNRDASRFSGACDPYRGAV